MHKKFKTLIIITSLLGVFAVIFGAFGSHYLRERLDPQSLNAWRTAVDYQFYHTLAIFCTALLYRIYRIKGLFFICLFFLGGIGLFSGSLYLLSTRSLTGIPDSMILGLATPLGGLALMGSWAAVFFTVIRIKTT